MGVTVGVAKSATVTYVDGAINDSNSTMRESLPCPTSLRGDRIYQINNLQIGFADPVELSDDGSIEIDGEGSLYEV